MQKQKIREWAQLHDISQVTFYEDLGASGGTMEQEGLQELLSDVESGDVDTVVSY